MKTCEKCGMKIPFGVPICPNCGGQGKKEANLEEDNKSCPACGANIEEGQKFCIKCGQHLDFSKINKKVPIEIENETVTAEGKIETQEVFLKKKINIDINAHIKNIACRIGAGLYADKAYITFENLGFGIVTAVKLTARGLTTFGDIVQVNGKEDFQIIIQDIRVEKNSPSKENMVSLPSPDIRKLQLEECQVCFADGTVATYQGAQNKEFEVELLEGIEPKKELAEAVKECVSREGKIIPQTIEEGWLCSCETYNSKDFEICTKCGTRKEDVLKITSEEGREEILAEYREKTVARNKRTAQSKRKFRKWAAIGIGVTVIIFVIVILMPFINPKYLSEQEMLNAVRGTYSNNEYYADEQIIINSVNIVTFKRYNSWEGQIETERVDVTKWDYRNGGINVDGKRMVFNAQGDLICNGEKYSKGGELYIPENDYYNDSYYEYEEPLEIVVDRFYFDYIHFVCEGRVINNTKTTTYKNIEVLGKFKDSSGRIVDKDTRYVVGSEGLEPGESRPFTLFGDDNQGITSVEVELKK